MHKGLVYSDSFLARSFGVGKFIVWHEITIVPRVQVPGYRVTVLYRSFSVIFRVRLVSEKRGFRHINSSKYKKMVMPLVCHRRQLMVQLSWMAQGSTIGVSTIVRTVCNIRNDLFSAQVCRGF